MERAEATEGASWLQWRKVARKKHKTKRQRRYRNGTSRSCRRCFLVAKEEGCQEEAQKKKGREEGEADEDSGKRRIRNEIAQEVDAGIK